MGKGSTNTVVGRTHELQVAQLTRSVRAHVPHAHTQSVCKHVPRACETNAYAYSGAHFRAHSWYYRNRRGRRHNSGGVRGGDGTAPCVRRDGLSCVLHFYQGRKLTMKDGRRVVTQAASM